MNRSIVGSLGLLLLVVACVRLDTSNASGPIYDETADAHHDISAAIAKAGASKKNVVLIFGANWCEDCHALHDQLHKPELAAIIAANFVVVNIDIGLGAKNLDLAQQYHVAVQQHGIPALAVLDSHGNLLYGME